MQKLNLSPNNLRLLFFAILTIICHATLLIVFNEKTYLLIALIYSLSLFFVHYFTLKETVLLSLVFFLPIEHGLRSWITNVVIANPFEHLFGYSFYFGFSIKFILAVFLLLLAIYSLKKVSNSTVSHLLSWFFLVLIGQVVVTPPGYLLIGLSRLLVPLACFIGANWLIRQNSKLPTYIAIIVLISLLFQTIVGTYQLISNHPLGIMLEDTSSRTFYQTSDGDNLIRVSGMLGHPTFFGSFITLLIPFLFYFLSQIKKNLPISKKYMLIFFSLTPVFLSLIGTYSRSAWIITILLTVIYFGRKKIYPIASGILIIVALLGFTFPIISRLGTIQNFFSTGSGRGRLDLINRSITMIIDHPVWGVGLNQFTAQLTYLPLSDNEKGFVYPVHNTWLLLISETGIPATILLILLIYKIMTTTKSFSRMSILTPFWFGAIAFLLSSQIHPLLNQDPTFDYFFLFLGVLSSKI